MLAAPHGSGVWKEEEVYGHMNVYKPEGMLIDTVEN